MKIIQKHFLFFILLILTRIICSNNNSKRLKAIHDCSTPSGNICGTKTHFSLRPQHINEARKMTAVEDKIHCFNFSNFNGVISLALQYQETFNSEKLAKYFFGKEKLTYGPNCDGRFDIYGRNLGTAATGTITNKPKIKNFIADIDLWLGLDQVLCSLWTRLNIPINKTEWSLNTCVNKDTTSSTFFDSSSLENIEESLAGDLAPRANCARICKKTKTTAISGLAFDLGYDFFRRETGYFGASLHFVAPTGTKPNDSYLFSAVSGTQHSWELGATITASYLGWQSCDANQHLGIFFDATITHLYFANQKRLFNFKKPNGSTNPLSYWMLLKKFNPSTGSVEGIERAANILCCDVDVGAKVMADIGLMLQYDCGCFAGALGWNLWYRSSERLKCNVNDCNQLKTRSCNIPAQTYGIKGSTLVGNTETMSNATIGNCGSVDIETVYLTSKDIAKCSALHPRALSNKLFGWFGYNWKNYKWNPFLAIEGEIEVGHYNRAVDQWGIILKGGLAF